MFIKKPITIYALSLSGRHAVFFRTKAEALYYQKLNYQAGESDIVELDAIEDDGQVKHFHYKPSAANHRFGTYVLDPKLRAEILNQNQWVLVGLNRPYPNKRIAGSPASSREAGHFIWAGKCRNALLIKDAKLINRPIKFVDQVTFKIAGG